MQPGGCGRPRPTPAKADGSAAPRPENGIAAIDNWLSQHPYLTLGGHRSQLGRCAGPA